MSLGRRCRSCGAHAVHRAPRQDWQRWLAWIVPLRPQHCIECRAESWAPLHADEGLARYAVATAFWLLIIALLWPRGDTAPLPATERRTEPVPAATPAPEPEAPTASIAATPAPGAATAEPVPAVVTKDSADVAEVSADDTPPPEARQRAMQLDGIDVRWTGEGMEVVVRADGGVLLHALRFDANVQGYLLDLPGRWTLPNSLRMVRSFERSNLLRMRIGRHRDFLRIVFSLRDPAAPEPQIERRDGELRLLVR